MFKLSKKWDPYDWPVQVQIPRDGGRFVIAEFFAKFMVLPQSEIDAIIASSQDGTGQDEALMDRVLVGWSGLLGDDDAALPYSDEAKSELLNYPPARIATARAFFESLRGKERQRKNS